MQAITCQTNGIWTPSFSCVSCPSGFERINPLTICIEKPVPSCIGTGVVKAVLTDDVDLANYLTVLREQTILLFTYITYLFNINCFTF